MSIYKSSSYLEKCQKGTLFRTKIISLFNHNIMAFDHISIFISSRYLNLSCCFRFRHFLPIFRIRLNCYNVAVLETNDSKLLKLLVNFDAHRNHTNLSRPDQNKSEVSHAPDFLGRLIIRFH